MASKLCPHYQLPPELNTEATEVVRASQRFAAESGDPFWQPASLLAKLAAEGKTFN